MIKNMLSPLSEKSRPLALLGLGLLWSCVMISQESVNASGSDASGSGGTAAFTVGQIVYTSNTEGTGTVDQGVQHAFEVFTLGIKETMLNISLTAFPNPTADNLTLSIKDYTNEKLYYQLFDMQGKQLSNGQIVAQQTQINMNSLPTATYFVNIVNQEKKQVQSFKIIKNQKL